MPFSSRVKSTEFFHAENPKAIKPAEIMGPGTASAERLPSGSSRAAQGARPGVGAQAAGRGVPGHLTDQNTSHPARKPAANRISDAAKNMEVIGNIGRIAELAAPLRLWPLVKSA
jgi:hypothetical protein